MASEPFDSGRSPDGSSTQPSDPDTASYIGQAVTLAEPDAGLAAVAARYAVAITPAMEDLIDPANPSDPIAQQFRPDSAELATAPEEHPDPIGDLAHQPVKGIVHRYPDRVLLTPVFACPVYCRFCFRRERVGPGKDVLSARELDAALEYIAARPEIWEVILTGGDPMILSARRLANLIGRLDQIGHVQVLRVHTRVPVVDPDRVTAELVAALRGKRVTTWVAVHTNHPRELTPTAGRSLARLADGGIPLVSQTVLLAGVNDSADVLEELFRSLVRHRVKPYYLHQLDPAPGTARFRVGLTRGRALVGGLRGRVSGLCQPSYVLDIPGGHGKARVAASEADRHQDGWSVADWQGSVHRVDARITGD